MIRKTKYKHFHNENVFDWNNVNNKLNGFAALQRNSYCQNRSESNPSSKNRYFLTSSGPIKTK